MKNTMSTKNDTDKIEISPLWICKHCNHKLVEIHKKTFISHPLSSGCNIRSLPKNWKSSKSEWIKICPKCDAYVLGIELKEEYTPRFIRNKTGDNITIHDIEINWET